MTGDKPIPFPLTDTITQIREFEMVQLKNEWAGIGSDDAQVCIDFLRKEFEREKLHWPDTTVPFDEEAAREAAIILYVTARLVLFRKEDFTKYASYFTINAAPDSASVILSADLCLRFLPKFLPLLKHLNEEDPLLICLRELLQKWHYSGIEVGENPSIIETYPLPQVPFIQQLYINRIVQHKNLKLAMAPTLRPLIADQLGIYAKELWPEFDIENTVVHE